MIAFHANGNLILQQAFKSKSNCHSIVAYNAIMSCLAVHGLAVDLNPQKPLAVHGLEEFFSSCAVVSVLWFWREIGFGVT
jgi:hypothetical protein